MLSVREDKFTSINSLIKQKLRNGFCDNSFLEKIFREFGSIVNLNICCFLELLEICFRDKNDDINAFATSCFKFLFDIPEVRKKIVILKLIGLICEKSASDHLPFSVHSDYKTSALNILKELERNKEGKSHTLELMNNLHEIMKIMDEPLNTHQFRLALDIVCSLSYSVKTESYSNENHRETASAVREHLKMIVNKLLGSQNHESKKQGIIAAVKIVSSQVLNYSSISYSEKDDSNDSTFEIHEIPEGPPREAANFVVFIIGIMKENAELMGLLFDEFSLEFSIKRSRVFSSHPYFLMWFAKYMMQFFEDHFVAEVLESDVGGVKMSLQYNLNLDQEEDPTAILGIDISRIIFNQTNSDKILLLTPCFKLLRTLIFINKRELDEINACLGCGMLLPDCFQQDNTHLYDDFDEETAKKILDSYFHCCNWLREVVR
jgi:hypothetical protein